jgi:hypothetical protein
MLPGAMTTDEEAACCREMAPDCGQGNMPSSHSCCKTLSASDQAALAQAPFQLFQQLSLLYIAEPGFNSTPGVMSQVTAIISVEHSSPESPPSLPEILRV